MKTIKRLTVSVVICVLLLSSVFVVNAETLPEFKGYVFTPEDYEDMGYIFDGVAAYGLPEGAEEITFFDDIPLYGSTPLYPEFDPAKLPWDEMPSYIQDIVYLGLDRYKDAYTPKVPFILISVGDGFCNIWVGTNLFLGSLLASNVPQNNVRICSSEPYLNGYGFTSSCYYAVYRYSGDDYSLSTPWAVRSPSYWGDKNRVYQYSTSVLSSSRDTYLSGANMSRPYYYRDDGTLAGFSTWQLAVQDGYEVHSVMSDKGFVGMKRYFSADPTTSFFTSFTPPTLEQIEQDTQKGIWQSIKEIPDKIGGFFESLKNYLLYFQDTEPEHVNPFAGILDSIQGFFDEQIGDTQDFKDSLNETLDKVSSYIETGSSVINKLLSGVPLLNAFVIFFLVFAVIRKVVGR